ncbi:MAG: glycosyltransferase family 4 protein, partial [Candidatus Rokuibacteriota bacterium]
HEPRIVVPRATRSLPAWSTIDGVTVVRYHDPFMSFGVLYLPSLVLARAALRATVGRWPTDIVHAHHGISGLAAAWADLGPRCYTFYGPWHLEFLSEAAQRPDLSWLQRQTSRFWIPAKARLARLIERAAVRRSEHVVVLSRFSARQVEAIHGAAHSRTTVIPGGVDLERFTPVADRRAAREALGLAVEGSLLFTVRRLVPRMGLEGLLRALAQLPGVQLVIGGSGILRASLERTAVHLGVADRVCFTGFIPDEQLARYYQAADLVVLPSLALEGFGLITLEALACGTPVVATPESGATDVLGSLESSWLAPDREPATFAQTVAAVLARLPRETDLARRCRAHAARYGWPRVVGQYEQLYRALRDRP